jgi:hypothetical protein
MILLLHKLLSAGEILIYTGANDPMRLVCADEKGASGRGLQMCELLKTPVLN